MAAISRRRSADDVLRRLSALGARVECEGDKIVLRAGARPVPPDLIRAAREAKTELSKMLNPAKALNNRESEHLRRGKAENPRISAAFIEDAQLAENEHLRRAASTFAEAQASRQFQADPAPKVLTGDAHLSAFGELKDFRGLQPDPGPKVLNPTRVSTFGQDEIPCLRRQAWPIQPRSALEKRRISQPLGPYLLAPPVLAPIAPLRL